MMIETIMENSRADRMWNYIMPYLARFSGRPASEPSEPLRGLSVIDLGSGYGDFSYRALRDGADYVVSVDKSPELLNVVSEKCAGVGRGVWSRYVTDLGSKQEQALLFHRGYDVGICTSVLPYLKYPDDLLFMMSMYCTASIIECQYAGDGPGFDFLRDDSDMEKWLSGLWKVVKPIGMTYVEIRPAYRTIWLCAMGKAI